MKKLQSRRALRRIVVGTVLSASVAGVAGPAFAADFSPAAAAPQPRYDKDACDFFRSLMSKIEQDALIYGNPKTQIIYIAAYFGQLGACGSSTPALDPIFKGIGDSVRFIDNVWNTAQQAVQGALAPNRVRFLAASELLGAMTAQELNYAKSVPAYAATITKVQTERCNSEGISFCPNFDDNELATIKKASAYGKARGVLEQRWAALQKEATDLMQKEASKLGFKPGGADEASKQLFGLMSQDAMATRVAEGTPIETVIQQTLSAAVTAMNDSTDLVYTLSAEHSGKVLTWTWPAPTQENPVSGASQRWEFIRADDGSFQLKSSRGCLFAGAMGLSYDDCRYTHDDARWKRVATGAGSFQLINVMTNQALEVAGASRDAGAKLQLGPINGGAHQKFHVVQTSTRSTPDDPATSSRAAELEHLIAQDERNISDGEERQRTVGDLDGALAKLLEEQRKSLAGLQQELDALRQPIG
jgi:hypothetical protein